MAKRTAEDTHQEYMSNMDEDPNPNEMLIRFKWLGDNCSTIDQVITRLEKEIDWYRKMQHDGWELMGAIDDDYGYLKKTVVQDPHQMYTDQTKRTRQ